uniref:Ctr_140_T conopeptide n=1 Tax=Conus tribblei TaxID=101761 RepID=A0A0C9RYH9_CONTD
MSTLGVALFTFLLLFPLATLQPIGGQPADRNAEPRAGNPDGMYGFLMRIWNRHPHDDDGIVCPWCG